MIEELHGKRKSLEKKAEQQKESILYKLICKINVFPIQRTVRFLFLFREGLGKMIQTSPGNKNVRITWKTKKISNERQLDFLDVKVHYELQSFKHWG